eukprot:GEMP01031280.1.p1 GENE.GEMP01031280.1~~GEMP01031280.1.p1  ORF type:complete len:574 (-),score=142.37 GEMP01031280.1:304-2025(-)
MDPARGIDPRVVESLKRNYGDSCDDFLQSLRAPPQRVCVRLCGDETRRIAARAELLTLGLREASPTEAENALSAEVRSQYMSLSVADTVPPRDEGDSSTVYVDKQAAIAVWRGADLFCAGVMALRGPCEAGRSVRIQLVPNTRVTKGTIIEHDWDTDIVAEGTLQVNSPKVLFGMDGTAVIITCIHVAQVRRPRLCSVNNLAVGRVWAMQLPSLLAAYSLASATSGTTENTENRIEGMLLDMCAAPGGKTLLLAEALPRWRIVALDRSFTKVRRLQIGADAIGCTNLSIYKADSTQLLVDAPYINAATSSSTAYAHAAVSNGKVAACGTTNGTTTNCTTTACGTTNGSNADPNGVTSVDEDVRAMFLDVMSDPNLRGRKRSEKKLWKALASKVGGRSRCSRAQFEYLMRAHNAAAPSRETASAPHSPPHAPPPWHGGPFFDKILCDVPCTAMGQKPMLDWDATLEDVDQTSTYQRQFLRQAFRLLKPGGDLLYSTCTLTADENERNVAWALEHLQCDSFRLEVVSTGLEHPKLWGLENEGLPPGAREKVLRFDPRDWDLGFFAAKLRKVAKTT